MIFKCPITTGLLQIGKHEVGTVDFKNERTIWEVYGTVIIGGKVSIGSGSKISVAKDSTLKFGENFILTGRSSIICQNSISFGKHCLLSWDILIMDTDFHKILNEEHEVVNSPSSIQIGDHVWIGCRCTILKGVTIVDDVVIAACSTITHSIKMNGVVYGGNGRSANVLKTGVTWEL